MARWSEIEGSEPSFAQAARAFLEARTHKTIATLRKDGSPRISGIEASFVEGDIWFGGMWRSLKALDLRRDPRFSLHSGSVDPPEWRGDAKIAGRAVEVHEDEVKRAVASASDGEEQSGPYHLYRADLHEVTIVRLGEPADHLVIEWWREGDGLRRKQRR